MNKSIIFMAVIIATTIMAAIESVTIGLPSVNPRLLYVCGSCLVAGLIHLKFALYGVKDFVWCILGGLSLTAFMTVAWHSLEYHTLAVEAYAMNESEVVAFAILTATYITACIGISLYLFFGYFCDLKLTIQDYKC